jgi:hypothetical protein
MATYDLREARGLLRQNAERRAPREAAHRQLVDALLQLDGADGLRVTASGDPAQVEFELKEHSATLLWLPARGDHFLSLVEGHLSPLRFEFNSTTGRFAARGRGEETATCDPIATVVAHLQGLWRLDR